MNNSVEVQKAVQNAIENVIAKVAIFCCLGAFGSFIGPYGFVILIISILLGYVMFRIIVRTYRFLSYCAGNLREHRRLEEEYAAKLQAKPLETSVHGNMTRTVSESGVIMYDHGE